MKKIRGHSHTPAIAKGAYQVGVPMKAISYNNPKTWKLGQNVSAKDLKETYFALYGGEIAANFTPPHRREAIEHTRRKLGL